MGDLARGTSSMTTSAESVGQAASTSLLQRLMTAVSLLVGLRAHDLRAAGTFMASMYPSGRRVSRWWRFLRWVLHQTFGTIPEALTSVAFDRPVKHLSIWLAEDNPFASHPWCTQPDAAVPEQVEVAVVGAGFTGAACAYHWAKLGKARMVLLEMNDPATGASGNCEGLVVMGRYFALVMRTVRAHLDHARTDLSLVQRDQLASQFAAAYVRSAYKNAAMIEETIAAEGYDCGYVRRGWIQAQDADDQTALAESVYLSHAAGFEDWTSIQPDEAFRLGGVRLDSPAGFSKGAAHFQPAQWVWCLLETALQQPTVSLFTRTRVLQIQDAGNYYQVHTSQGSLRARYVINATESFTTMLHPECRGLIAPVQTQGAFALGGPLAMEPDIGLSCKRGWFGLVPHEGGVIFGSDATHISDEEAGRNRPSRFITKFMIGEIRRYFGHSSMQVTHEWSSTAGFTVDEYPVVGLLDGKRQYLIGGMCGSGTGVSFNAARHVVQQILDLPGPDDYPAQYFAPTRLLDPQRHLWPALEYPSGPDNHIAIEPGENGYEAS